MLHLRDVRHEVVGDALRVLAHCPRGVGAHGVEVAEQEAAPVLEKSLWLRTVLKNSVKRTLLAEHTSFMISSMKYLVFP